MLGVSTAGCIVAVPLVVILLLLIYIERADRRRDVLDDHIDRLKR